MLRRTGVERADVAVLSCVEYKTPCGRKVYDASLARTWNKTSHPHVS